MCSLCKPQSYAVFLWFSRAFNWESAVLSGPFSLAFFKLSSLSLETDKNSTLLYRCFQFGFQSPAHWALGIGRYTGAEGVEENGWVYARNFPKYLHQSAELCLILPAGRNSWLHKCRCWVLFIQAPLWKSFAKQIHQVAIPHFRQTLFPYNGTHLNIRLPLG